MQPSGASSAAREVADGRFVRQQSRFTDWVTADGSSGHRAEPGRYHLYVARACP
jgi:glutathionyl-hydroquinone reductase